MGVGCTWASAVQPVLTAYYVIAHPQEAPHQGRIQRGISGVTRHPSEKKIK